MWFAAMLVWGTLISAYELPVEGQKAPDEWRKLLMPDDDDGGTFGD